MKSILMKRTIIIVLTILLAAGWGVRFYWLNKSADKLNIQTFKRGTTVPVGKDFFDVADEDMDGYTVKVLDASILTSEKFLQKYNATDQRKELGNFTDYIYIVHVVIGNRNNPYGTQKGIGLTQYILKGTDYILTFDEFSYQLANPNMPGASFSLSQNTEKEFTLTFSVTELTSYKHLKDDPPKLQISLYPTQKLLDLY